jgi:DNA mismatch endonuclease, patch repair protein
MTIDPQRAATMRAVKSCDTKPEREIRSLLHRRGFRFRLQRDDLPGKPDIVFPGRKKVIFVHGCFWHGHDCKRGARQPKSNSDYWKKKIGRNKSRDIVNANRLHELGWQVLTIWECDVPNAHDIAAQLTQFLS